MFIIKKHIFFVFSFLSFILLLSSSCVYFNTYYLAQKSFKDAEYNRKRSEDSVSSEAKKKYKEAVEWASAVVQDSPKSKYVDDSLRIIGLSYYYQKEYYKSQAICDKFIETYQDSKYFQEMRYIKARTHIGMEDFDNARLVLNEILSTGTEKYKSIAGITLAEIASFQKDWSELLQASQKVIDSKPGKEDLVKALSYKGEALYELEKYEDCIKIFENVLDYKSNTEIKFKANSFIALSKAKTGKFDDALKYLSSMEGKGQFERFQPKIRLRKGNIYELKHDYDTAMDSYRKMAGDYPDSLEAKEAWYHIGDITIKDLSKAKEAKNAFMMVEKGNARASESWVIDSKLKSVLIDTLFARVERVEKAQKDTLSINLAHERFSLAELYNFSFNRPDSADTQYRLIIEEAPETDFAVRSKYFIKRYELLTQNKLTDETNKEIISEIVKEYPDSDFSQKLKVFLGLIDNPPDVQILRKAELSRFSGDKPEKFLPLFKAVIDSFPESKSAYQAKYIIAYTYEHDLGKIDEAKKLYEEIADTDRTLINADYVSLANEKLEYLKNEPKLIEDIKKYLAGFTGKDKVTLSPGQSIDDASDIAADSEPAYSEMRKIRARNARIRSRYFEN